jgi:hypothetical protein
MRSEDAAQCVELTRGAEVSVAHIVVEVGVTTHNQSKTKVKMVMSNQAVEVEEVEVPLAVLV